MIPKGFRHSDKTKTLMSDSHTNKDVFTTKETENILALMFGEIPYKNEPLAVQRKKREFRLKHFGKHSVCKTCIFNCFVLQYDGDFVCFKYKRRNK